MKVGFTGHQSRPGIRWPWVREQISIVLRELPDGIEGYSSLAAGSDQVFAEEVLRVGGQSNAVIPFSGYERLFESNSAARYRDLLGKSVVINLDLTCENEVAFYKAGKWIVDRCDIMIAVWDGLQSQGLGGTADIVGYARNTMKHVVHIDVANDRVVRGTA